jgi:SAM-dependent methyltransferase
MDLARTAAYWDAFALTTPQCNPAEWLDHPLTRARLEHLRGGRSVEQWLIDRHLTAGPVARAASLGAGVATIELELLQRGAVQHWDLYDISQRSLDYAWENAKRLGLHDRITLHCADFEEITLAPDTYGLITFISSLHHVANLRDMLQKVNGALTPHGVFFADEYVGPDRFAYPPEAAALAQRFYRTIDPGLRSPWPELPLPTPDMVTAADPTESIHAAAIIPMVREYLSEVEITPFNHAFAFIIWWGLRHEALYSTPEGLDLVQTILDYDNALVNSGRLENYFSYIVGKKKALE